jgi:hypothetical protein
MAPSGPTGCHGCSAAIAAAVHIAINKTGIVRISRRMKLKQPFTCSQECNEIDMLILLQQVTEGQLIKSAGKRKGEIGSVSVAEIFQTCPAERRASPGERGPQIVPLLRELRLVSAILPFRW